MSSGVAHKISVLGKSYTYHSRVSILTGLPLAQFSIKSNSRCGELPYVPVSNSSSIAVSISCRLLLILSMRFCSPTEPPWKSIQEPQWLEFTHRSGNTECSHMIVVILVVVVVIVVEAVVTVLQMLFLW